MSSTHLASIGKKAITVLAIGAVALLLVLMSLNVSMPLEGDQSLYFFGARQMSDGHVLYRDYWDLKPPGVYAFYWVAGSLFGYTAVGLHTLEMIWFTLVAVLAYRLCAIATGSARLALLGPLFTVGAYFNVATPWHLTQPDGLLTLPLTFAAWALVEPRFRDRPMLGWALTGAGAGLASMFVTSSALVVLAFVAAAAVVALRTAPAGARAGVRRAGGFLIGFGAILLIPIIWFASLGALGDYLWTMVTYPLSAQGEFSRDIPKLVRSVKWFLEAIVLLLPCALIGALATVRDFWSRDSRALVGLVMFAWFVGGLTTLLLQYHYSWQFHFIHFFVPVGVLMVMGLGEILRAAQTREGRVVAAALLIMALAFPMALLKKVVVRAGVDTQASLHEDSVKQGLAASSPDDSVYVLGDPRVLLAAGRAQPVKHNGWALEVLLPHQWKEFSDALRQSRPAYLYVSRTHPPLLAKRAPELGEWIAQEYSSIHTDDTEGTWYRRRDL